MNLAYPSSNSSRSAISHKLENSVGQKYYIGIELYQKISRSHLLRQLLKCVELTKNYSQPRRGHRIYSLLKTEWISGFRSKQFALLGGKRIRLVHIDVYLFNRGCQNVQAT